MIQLTQKSSTQIAQEIAQRVKLRRKEKKWTQEEMAKRSGMSFASYKRFEQKHEIEFTSLIKIAIALDCEKDFDSLFVKKIFSSLEEMMAFEKLQNKMTEKTESK